MMSRGVPTATVVPTAPSETLSNGLSEKAGKELIDRVLALTLKLDKTNHFELLGIDFDTTPVGMSIAYLKFVEHFSPHYFSSGSLAQYRRQNENILLAAADAYADLRDNESKVRYNDKLKARRNAEENARKKIPGAAFKIQTDLLDASSQFEQGLKHLEQRHFDNAVKYFEYACDIDGREPLYIAYLAWSKYQKYGGASNASPSDAKEIGGLFETAIKEGTDNAKVNMLYGKYLSDKPETKKKGLFHLKKAVTLSPKDLEIERTFRLANSQNS
jgi:tetratricopeptide (TPR) repeat protein